MAKKNYVNNPEFLQAIVDYKKLCVEAEDSGDDKPQIPDYIGECIYQISTRLASKPNFSGYSYKDEMISDGLENAIQALGNFDPDKSSNPFAYFTQIIWYAFLRRIDKEKKQLYIKHKVTENSVTSGTAVESGSDDNGMPSYIDLDNDYMNDFVKNYEKKMDEKKRQQQKRAKKGLEKFIDNEE
ncbi:sigma factor for late transcription [bacterium]|nr:sigma factor for late transcription [bacterium]